MRVIFIVDTPYRIDEHTPFGSYRPPSGGKNDPNFAAHFKIDQLDLPDTRVLEAFGHHGNAESGTDKGHGPVIICRFEPKARPAAREKLPNSATARKYRSRYQFMIETIYQYGGV